MDINGIVYKVKTTVKKVKSRKGNTSNQQYSLEVQEMELIEKRPARQALGGSNAAITSADSTKSIPSANLLKGVEKSNKRGRFSS